MFGFYRITKTSQRQTHLLGYIHRTLGMISSKICSIPLLAAIHPTAYKGNRLKNKKLKI